jgi:DGQHR domain-containing protein
MSINELRLPALEVKQSSGKLLYSFAVDGKLISSFATVSRIHRKESHELSGYQRPEILNHISEIRKYVESDSPMIPNAVVIAFDPRIKFEPIEGDNLNSNYSRMGSLVIPINTDEDFEEKPGFIVDGQQRIAAIREAAVESFPVCVTAFVTDDIKEQTEQFILVNSTKPLPKGLIYELLPNTEATLSTHLQRRRFPAYLMELLNTEENSPLRNLIQTPTNPHGTIKDNSILKMIENSLSDGVLYRFRYVENGPGDVESMMEVLSNFWRAVSKVFKEAWNKSPRESRLVHGAGIIGMGFLMDAISERHKKSRIPTEEQFTEDLTPLKDVCNWTNGYWDFGPGRERKWNEIQNMTKDIQMLSNYLLIQYKLLVWSRVPSTPGYANPNQGIMFN